VIRPFFWHVVGGRWRGSATESVDDEEAETRREADDRVSACSSATPAHRAAVDGHELLGYRSLSLHGNDVEQRVRGSPPR